MLNLIKYELKGNIKDFIIAFGIILLLNLLLLTRVNTWESGAIFASSYMITFGAMIVVFIWNIKLFSKDMYSDSGYLLFTLPQRGYSILGSKVLTALIQTILTSIFALAFNFIVFTQVTKEWKEILSKVKDFINANFIVFGIGSGILQIAYLLLIIYFSISLSKVAIKNKKFGKLSAFIIFIVFSLIAGKISSLLVKAFPQSFKIDMLSLKMQSIAISPYQHQLSINVSYVIFNAIIFIGLFLITSYILENKVDL